MFCESSSLQCVIFVSLIGHCNTYRFPEHFFANCRNSIHIYTPCKWGVSIQQINLRSLHLFRHWRCPGLPSPQGEILPLVVCSLTSPGFQGVVCWSLGRAVQGINGPWFHLRFILQNRRANVFILMFIPFRRKTTVFSRLSTMWCFSIDTSSMRYVLLISFIGLLGCAVLRTAVSMDPSWPKIHEGLQRTKVNMGLKLHHRSLLKNGSCMMLASLPIDMSMFELALNDPKLFFRRIALVAVLPPWRLWFHGFRPTTAFNQRFCSEMHFSVLAWVTSYIPLNFDIDFTLICIYSFWLLTLKFTISFRFCLHGYEAPPPPMLQAMKPNQLRRG